MKSYAYLIPFIIIQNFESTFSLPFTRRDALNVASASIAASIPSAAISADVKDGEIDLEAIRAIRANSNVVKGSTSSGKSDLPSIVSLKDPGPVLSIRGGLDGKSTIKVPRVGYSFYKTSIDMAQRCTALALRAGVRNFDVGTSYGSNEEIAKVLKKYLDGEGLYCFVVLVNIMND